MYFINFFYLNKFFLLSLLHFSFKTLSIYNGCFFPVMQLNKIILQDPIIDYYFFVFIKYTSIVFLY